MNKRIAYIIVCVVMLIPVYTHAGPIIRSGESISVDATQVLKGDFYGLGSTVTISGAAENDAYIAGGAVTINAPIQGDLTILGGAVQVHGDIGDDLRVIGGEVTLAKKVIGDVVVLGGTLTVLSTAQIEGDILFMGGSLIVEGNVTGNIHGTADTARINAPVGGDVTLRTGSLFTLGDNANVAGSISYESRYDVVRAQNAQVGGDIRKTEVRIDTNSGFLNVYFFELGILLFAACSLYFIAKNRVQQVVSKTMQSLGMLGLIGLGLFLILPFIGGLLLVSLLGAVAGVLVFAVYVCLLVLAIILAGIFVGYYVEKYIRKSTTITLRTVVVGVVAFSLLVLIPYVGGLLMFACVVIMLGALGQSLYYGIKG